MAKPQESTSDPQWAILRYLQVLWKHRWLIGCGSVLPALALAGILHFQPGMYKAAFVYERPLTESEYNVLLRRFYSSENLGRITERLREKQLADYARRLNEARTEESLRQLIGFNVSPAYPRRSQNTDPVTSTRISAFQAQLLYLEIRAGSKQDTEAISAVIADDLENVLPIYDVRTNLKETIRQVEGEMAQIEETRFTMSTDIRQEQAVLERMESLEEIPSAAAQGSVVLQITGDPNTRALLPWSYQMRAVQAKIINLEQTLKSNQETYGYRLKILDLNEKLLEMIEQRLLTYYTVQQFVGFLKEELSQCKDEAVADYLRSYIGKTQNLALTYTRANQKPVAYAVVRYTAQSAAVVLIVLLMVTAFVAVALEYQNARGKLS